MNTDPVRAEAAEQLMLIARELRAAGDVRQVHLTPAGVDDWCTLSESLEIIAFNLDYDGCIARAQQAGPDSLPV